MLTRLNKTQEIAMADMQFGLMMRAQFPQTDDMQQRFRELMEQARLANTLGYSCITNGMHYSSTPFQDFQQMPFLCRMMAEAPDLRINFGLILLSLHKPLDVAEQIATADVLSGGKVIFGIALGYREVEFLAFGTRQRQRVQRFEENLEAIKRLWTEDTVDMVGSHFELKGATVPTKPLQKPYPPIWIGANADPAIRRAARLGDCWYVNPHNRIDTIVRQTELYKRALEEYGKPFPAEFPARREVFVAKTREEAMRLCKPFLAEKYKAYHQWGQDQHMPEGDNDLGQEFDDLVRDRFLVGSPDEVAEQMLKLNQATGINHLIMSVQWPGMPQSMVLDVLHMLAEDVFPKVRQG
jgi:alkanesulfonate monooxygenase SsuD/methylene tetrahydromethanopterin reductase-like flavin-dependent oxidoreductase (luciferase family)